MNRDYWRAWKRRSDRASIKQLIWLILLLLAIAFGVTTSCQAAAPRTSVDRTTISQQELEYLTEYAKMVEEYGRGTCTMYALRYFHDLANCTVQ